MTPRLGLLGLGHMGRTHAAAARAAGLEVVAYASRRPAPEELGLGAAVRLPAAEVIGHRHVDLVVECGPSEAHATHALAALRAGQGIVVEKPLATSLADARAVVALATERGLFGSVVSQRRFEPQHVALKRLLDAGALGRPLLGQASLGWWRDDAYYAAAAWRRTSPGGGVLLNQAIHSVDLLLWLLGDAAASGFEGTLDRPTDAADTAALALRFHSGALGVVAATTANPPGAPALLTIRTTTGSVTLAHDTVVEWTFPGVEPPQADGRTATGATDPTAIGRAGHDAQWRDIADAWASGRPPSVTLADGLRAVEACLAPRASAG